MACRPPRGLRRGFYMELGERDVKALMEAAGMDTSVRQGPLTRIDPKREQARARGLRRVRLSKTCRQMQRPWTRTLTPISKGRRPQIGLRASSARAARLMGASVARQPAAKHALDARAVRVQAEAVIVRVGVISVKNAKIGKLCPDRQEREPRRFDGDDEFSQRGVSHESPFETKAARKKIFQQ